MTRALIEVAIDVATDSHVTTAFEIATNVDRRLTDVDPLLGENHLLQILPKVDHNTSFQVRIRIRCFDSVIDNFLKKHELHVCILYSF